MRSNPYVPALRFGGFKGEWREIELQNACTFLKGVLLSKSHLTKDGHPCILYGELYTKYSEIIAEVTSRTNLPLKKMVLSRSGDVLLPSSGETSLEISTASFLGLDNVALGGDLTICRPKKDIDGKFLSYQINHAKKYDVARLAQGVSVVHIYPSLLKMLKVDIPPLPEQQKIASFFTLLDQRIGKQQEKISCLEEYKKGLMQKIFSREIRYKNENGEDYPEWKSVKVGDMGEVITGTTPPTNQDEFYNGDYLFVTPTDIISKYVISTQKKLSVKGLKKGKVIPKDSVLVTCIASIGKNAIIGESGSCNQQINAIVLHSNFYNEFIFYLMESHKERLIKYAGAGGMSILNKTDFSNIIFEVPVFQEQQKIGLTLSNIDDLIEKNRELLEQWKLLKKGLLQQMFI